MTPAAKQTVAAASRADLVALRHLVRDGADPNARWRGYRPLHALIQEKAHGEAATPSKARLACFAWLLAHGADPDQLGAWPPARALLVAAFTGIPEFVEPLAPRSARRDIFVAAALGDLPRVTSLLGADHGLANARDLGGLTALQCCAGSRLGARDERLRRRLIRVATLLLDAGADPNAMTKAWSHEVSVSYFAAAHLEMFDLLLARGADATAALSTAMWNGNPDAFGEAALRHGARVDGAIADGQPLLVNLVRWGRANAARWMLRHHADPNRPDSRGWTAVHQAASRGNPALFRAVVQAGGDPRRPDDAGITPFDIARARGYARLLSPL